MDLLYEDNYIRPPNEADSVILRLTRGCGWNRCRFCGIYDAMGTPFEIRPKEAVLADVARARHIYGPHARRFFLGDADPIVVDPADFAEVTQAIRKTFPECERITCYGRMATAWRRRDSLKSLRQSGLNRIHAGLETGSGDLLRFHRKGISQGRMISAGRAVVESGIELSMYVLLGLGGSDRWEEHVAGTVEALNAIRPQMIRFRRLWIHPGCALAGDVASGEFLPQTPEGTVIETRDILAGVDFPCEVECIHANNYVNFEGVFPADRSSILEGVNDFLARSDAEKEALYSRRSRI